MSTHPPTPPTRRRVQSRDQPPQRREFSMANPRRRGVVLLMVFLFALSLFGARLVELQVFRGSELAQAARNSRLVTNELPALRGGIYDASGRPLAMSVEVRNITADQTMIKDPGATAEVLAPLLDMEVAELQPLLTGKQRFIYLKKSMEPAVWRSIQDWRENPDNDAVVLEGIFSERSTQREYPNGQLAANVIGFTNDEGVGAAGLESGLDKDLSGTPGSVAYERAANGAEIPATNVSSVPPVAGTDVRLTLDSDLQGIAERVIKKQVKATKSDFGMAVVQEVRTGRILAMATGPSFDPAKPGEVEPEVWSNRPVTYAMEPGSTAKLMSLSGVLNEGVLSPRSKIEVPGSLPRGGENFKDAWSHGILRLTLGGVLAESSNIGTIMAAEKIGEEKLVEYLEAFGVGRPTGLDLPGEQSGLLPDRKNWSDTTFPTLAFGQGMSLTAVQLTSMVAAISNDGVYLPPKLVDSFVSPDGSVATAETAKGHRVISTEAARQMQEMMQLVVQPDGTAPNVKVPGYLVGGKTGTAERYDEDAKKYVGYTASFIGMAPADRPELVVGVWLDRPRGGYYGAELAGPVFNEIMTAALAGRGIPPTGAKPTKLPTTYRAKSGPPDVTESGSADSDTAQPDSSESGSAESGTEE